MSFRARLSARFHFECAHYMPEYPQGHRNRRMHGHSYTGEVVVEGVVDERSGMVREHEQLERAVREVTEALDHQLLNEIPGLEIPTGEHIARWIWLRLIPTLPDLREVIVARESVGIRISYSESFQ